MVVTHDLACVLFFLFFLSLTFVALIPLTELVESRLFFLLLLFFIFPSLIERLEILVRNKRYSINSFGFLFVIVFYCFLNLDFVCGGVGQLTCFKTILIGFPYVKTRLQTPFILAFYRFCYQLFIIIQLSSVLINLGFNRKFQLLFKISYHRRLRECNSRVKFNQDRLKVFKVKSQIIDSFS